MKFGKFLFGILKRRYFIICLLLCGTLHIKAQIVINELLASNLYEGRDPDFSEYVDWIEIRNLDNQILDLSGYFLSNDVTDLDQWAIPSGTIIASNGYLLFWCDKKDTLLHTNFKLNRDGETIFVVSPSLEIVDSISFGEQLQSISFGRSTDTSQWMFFNTPTPGGENEVGFIYATPPIFSIEGGFYISNQMVSLSVESGTIHYTLDGSDPTQLDSIYEGPIRVDTTTVIRAKVFELSKEPSTTISHTFFINENTALPVISISTNPENFFDDEIGIYVTGTNGIIGNGSDIPRNWNQDWEREVNIEYYGKDKQLGFNQKAGIKIFGNFSRLQPMKSLSVFARDQYGKDEFTYPLFEERSLTSYKSFVLRNSGNDFDQSFMRDGMIQSLVINQMDIDCQAYQPSIVYLNGQYWGIHNMREKVNEDYIQAHHGADQNNLDLLAAQPTTPVSYAELEGTDEDYISLLTFVDQENLAIDYNYEYVKKLVDLDEFINYQVVQIYIANQDWSANNQKIWREKLDTTQWRWLLFDLDISYGIWGNGQASYNSLNGAIIGQWFDQVIPSSSYLLRNLLVNPEFESLFIKRYLDIMNTVFYPNRVIAQIDKIKDVLKPEMMRHLERWGSESNTTIAHYNRWNQNVEDLKQFSRERFDNMKEFLQQEFGLDSLFHLIIEPPDTLAELYVNGKEVIGGVDGLYFKNYPIQITALPKPGYSFTHWEGASFNTASQNLVDVGSEWKYLDDGSDQDSSWRFENFDDTVWVSGLAELGYGDGDENTVVGYGADPDNKYLTTYFRKEFQVEDSLVDELMLSLKLDDGAVVYLNGSEILRSNMPSGEITYHTFANTQIGEPAENTFGEYTILPDFKLTKGTNLLAVEVHQGDTNSSDITFDLGLSVVIKTITNTEQLYNNQVTISPESNYQLKPVLVPGVWLDHNDIRVNEVLASNDSGLIDGNGEFDDWIELYNRTDSAIDIGGFYMTDDLLKPTKFRFPIGDPSSTTIPAKGFLHLWADDDENQGPLHLNFNLKKGGEQIGLSWDGINFIDEIAFGEQVTNVSYGLFPDGAGQYYMMDLTTPGTSNDTTTFASSGMTITSVVDALPPFVISPNPTSNHIVILSHFPFQNLSVSNMVGKTMDVDVTKHSDQKVILDLTQIPSGLYWMHLKLGNKKYGRKIIKF